MNRAARRILVVFALLLLPVPAFLAAPPDGDLRLSDLIREAPPAPPSSLSRRGEGAGRALDGLLAGRNLPIPCASTLLLELWRHRDALPYPARESLRLLSVRPALPHDGSYQTRDGRFTIHYTLDSASPDAIEGTDSDLNGIPDRVDQVEMALDRAVAVLGADLSWPLPVAGPRMDQYDLYLVNLGPGRSGFTVLDREIATTPQNDVSSHILIDSRMDPAQTEAAVIHQYAHASLMALSARAPAWWTEATAAWMELQVTGDPSSQREAMARRLERLDLSLAGDSVLLSLGDSLWASFLADRFEGGGEEIQRIWTEASLRSAEPFASLLDEILLRNGGSGLGGAYRDFTRWTLFTGTRNDGAHFRLGSLFPDPAPRAVYESFPAESPATDAVEPLGASVYRLVGDGSRGGLRIHFETEAPSRLEADLIVTPRQGDRRPYLVELRPDPGETADVGIPWRDVAETMLIVRNPAFEGKAARYRFTASLDPLFPFDLSSFAAIPSDGGITLQWSTLKETDLLGWNILRSDSPAGPFHRVNPVTLPSGGDSQEETNYLYQDSSATAGARHFYLVEGITLQGLPERSFPVSCDAPKPDSIP